MNKKFIYFKTKTQFTAKLSSLPNNAIVFIEDTKQIWTHGVFFDTSWDYVGDKPDTYTPSAHSHGPITNDGKIGTLANRIIETTTGGLLTHVAKNTAYNKAFGTGADQVARGNHTHAYLPLTGGTLTGALSIDVGAANQTLLTLKSAGVSTSLGSLNGSYFHMKTDATGGFYSYQNITAPNFLGKATSAGSADNASNSAKLEGVALKGLFTTLTKTTDNKLSITVGGTNKTLALGSNAFDSTAYLPLSGGSMSGPIQRGNAFYNVLTSNISGTGIVDIQIPDVNFMGDIYVDLYRYSAVSGTLKCQVYTYFGSSDGFAGNNSVRWVGSAPPERVRYVTIGTGNRAERHILIGNADTNWGGHSIVSINKVVAKIGNVLTHPLKINFLTTEPTILRTSLAVTDFYTQKANTTNRLDSKVKIAGVDFDGAADIAIPFSNLISKPTTLEGYGITDAAPKSHSDITGANTIHHTHGNWSNLNGINQALATTSSPTFKAVTLGTIYSTGDVSVLNGGSAQRILTGGLLASSAYADASKIPANGIYSRGKIDTLSHGDSNQWNTAYGWGNHANGGYVKKVGDTMSGSLTATSFVKANVANSQNYLLQADGGHILKSSFSESGHTHNYLPLTGGVIDGSLDIKQSTSAIPALGTRNSSLYVTANSLYGMQFGIIGSGVGFIQQGRTDGTATSYSLSLQPSGGNVLINNQVAYHAGNIPTWNQSTTGNAATASAVSTSAENTGTTSRYILFANSASGNQALKTDTGLKYVPSTNTISANISGNLSGGTVNGTALGVTNASASTGLGLSLYGGPTIGIPQYGMTFAGTPTFGTHGAVTGDWATYLTMTGAATRGWIFKLGTTNVASISAAGVVTATTFSGDLTGNASSATALTSNAGSNTKPIYFSSGKPVASTYSFGNASGNIPISNGTLNTNLNSDLLDGNHGSYYTGYTDMAIDNIEIGGRNLLIDSNKFKSGSYIGGSVSPEGWAKYDGTASGANGMWAGFLDFHDLPDKLEDGEPFMVSFQVKGEVGAILPRMYINNKNAYLPIEGYISEEFSTAYQERVWDSSGGDITVHFSGLGKSVYYFKDFKIEKGNKPTDWTPAPEDQVSDWLTTDVNSFSFIKNKPSTFTPSAHTHTFASLTSKPTTLSGYGITDAYTKTQVDTSLNSKFDKTGGRLTTGTGDVNIELWRGTNASWDIINTAGYLKFRSNYTTTAGAYFDVLTLDYNTGHAKLKGNFTAPTFIGALTGNASSATYASAVTLTADNTTNATRYPLFVDAATGNKSPRTDTGFTYNPYTGALTATSFLGKATSAGDADTVGGLAVNPVANTSANRLVRTNASGYIQASYINTTSGTASGTLNRVYVSQDSYLRYLTPSSFISNLGLATESYVDAIKPWRIYDSVATKPNTDNDIFAYVIEPNIMTNKLWFYNIGLFLFEGSNDGVSFSTINVSTNDLKKVLSNFNPEAVHLSLPSYRHFRITITGNSNRVALTALQMKMITYVKAVNILIESHRNTDSNWHPVVNTVWAGGYPDTMTLRHDSFQLHPTWTGGNGSDKARITISYADGSANVLSINSLRWYGSFSFNDDIANRRDVYEWDYEKNVTFPSNVTAPTFIGALSGNAATATALTTSAGSATQPVYFSGGKPVATTYSLGKSVPSNAVFTDTNTHYTTRLYAGASGTATNTVLSNPYIKVTDDNSYSNQIQLYGGSNVTIASDVNGRITINSSYTDTNTWKANSSTSEGYVAKGVANMVWKTDGSGNPAWRVDANTTYSNFTKTVAGLVPAPTGSTSTRFLREDGQWHIPSSTEYTAGTGISLNNKTFNLNTATASALGGVKLFDDTIQSGTSKVYGVQLNSSGQMVVNVPWTDTNTNTTYSAGTGLSLSGTTFNVNYGTAAGTAAQGNDSRINNGQTAYGWGNHASAGYLTSIPLASTSNIGGGYLVNNTKANVTLSRTTTANRYYPVQLNTSNQMMVNVPWTDTTSSYSLPIATASTLGGIKVGTNLSINSSTGVLSATDTTYNVFTRTIDGLVPKSGGSTTTRYLREDGTWETPPNTGDTHWVTGIRAGASGTTTNSAVTNPYIKVRDDSTHREQIRLKGDGATTVKSDASGNVTISSPNKTYTTGTLLQLFQGTNDVGMLQSAKNLNKWLGDKFQVVTSLPTSPTAGVFYFIKE